jgi:hypothetical protein
VSPDKARASTDGSTSGDEELPSTPTLATMFHNIL